MPAHLLILDPFGGLAGDMLLGGLLDLGLSAADLEAALRTLEVSGWVLHSGPTTRRHLGCQRVWFEIEEQHHHRHLSDIVALIEGSQLSPGAQRRARAIFERLAAAEARVHRIPVEQVHFHEVGAVDAILDVCGVAWALDQLGVEQVYSTALPAGSGQVRCAHGELPVPAPATLELLAGFTLLAEVGRGEMVTPTGAAVLAACGAPLPRGLAYRAHRAGYGAGSRDSSILRLTLAERAGALRTTDATEHHHHHDDADEDHHHHDHRALHDEVVQLESHIDDSTGEELGWLAEQLMQAGALDVAYAPLTMKKGRPGHRLVILAPEAGVEGLTRLVFAESSTLGVRVQRMGRVVLARRMTRVETRWGPVGVKLAGGRGRPEYGDCAAIARREGVPLRDVMQEAEHVWRAR